MARLNRTRLTRSTAILFLAASSVYPNGANTATAQSRVIPSAKAPASEVKLLDDSNDPFGAAPTTTESATTQPAAGGQSVTATQVNTSISGNVEIHVNEANILEVLRMLSLQSQRNIVASKDVKGTVTANLYDVTVREALAAILKQNDLVSVEDGPVIYIYTRKEYQEVQKANRRTATEVFTLHYLPVVDAEKMVKNLLSADGKTVISSAAKSGIAFANDTTGGDDNAGSSILVVTDYEENLANVTKLIEEVDVRPTQILVEATILRASLNENNALGVDFTVLGGVDFTTVNTNNGLITGANTSGSTVNGNNSISSGGTGNNFTNTINNGLKLGFVNSNVAIFLSALEETTDTAVLANPKVLVLNKQKGEVKVVRKDPYRGATTYDPSGQSRQEVEIQETGTKLIFRPFVGNDGFIRLEIHPEDSTALPSSSTDLPPSQLSTEATTNVLVKDGRTIVIGGLFRESVTTTRSQIPILGDIPVAGNLFRKKQDSTIREEIIILLTPHIVKDDEAYSRLSKSQERDAERVRVGIRKGMMPWGRERLAESAFEAAQKELAKPNPNKKVALWHLDCATNLNPRFLEAIDLKERVSGNVVTTSDNSSIRSFVRDAILASQTAQAKTVDDLAAAGPTTQPMHLVSPEEASDMLAAVDATTQPTTAPAPMVAQTETATEPAAVETPVAAQKPVAPGAGEPVSGEPVAAVTVTESTEPTTQPVTSVSVRNPLIDPNAPVPAAPSLLPAAPDAPVTADPADAHAVASQQPEQTEVAESHETAAAPSTRPADVLDTPAFKVTELPADDAFPGAGK